MSTRVIRSMRDITVAILIQWQRRNRRIYPITVKIKTIVTCHLQRRRQSSFGRSQRTSAYTVGTGRRPRLPVLPAAYICMHLGGVDVEGLLDGVQVVVVLFPLPHVGDDRHDEQAVFVSRGRDQAEPLQLPASSNTAIALHCTQSIEIGHKSAKAVLSYMADTRRNPLSSLRTQAR